MNYLDIVGVITGTLGTMISLLSLHFIIFSIVGIFARKTFPKTDVKNKYGIIIPARDEELVVGNLIKSVYKNNYPQDKLHVFVIAHNCSDKTAEIARNLGATVYEYNNPNECTMGYAFRYLFKCIERDYGTQNYDGFFLFNADNILDKDYFTKMNDAFEANNKEAVITSFRNSKNFETNTMSGLYGLYFINGCRLESRGRTVCGCSTRVQGTGYVINSKLVKDGWNYVTLTEDWEFSADQIIQGNRIVYCDEAVFYDEQPTKTKVMFRQRLRWAKGHLLVCITKTKQLLKNLFKRNKDKKVHRFSTFDILVNIMPACVITAFVGVLNIALIALAPAFGYNAGEVWLNWLKNVGIGFGTAYLTLVVSAILVLILEHKRIVKVNIFKKILVCLAWPIFMALAIPIEIVALFSKNVGWKKIPHEDTSTFEKLNKSERTENEQAINLSYDAIEEE